MEQRKEKNGVPQALRYSAYGWPPAALLFLLVRYFRVLIQYTCDETFGCWKNIQTRCLKRKTDSMKMVSHFLLQSASDSHLYFSDTPIPATAAAAVRSDLLPDLNRKVRFIGRSQKL